MGHIKRLSSVFLKRFISMVVAFAMVLGVMPMESIIAFAEDVDPPIPVYDVLVTKTYTGPNDLEVIYIEVNGTNLEQLGDNPVIVRDEMGEPTALTTIVENDYRLYYRVDKPSGVSRLSVGNKDYDIGQQVMPTINSIDPVNRMVSNEEEVIINGTGFKTFDDASNGEINFYNRSGSLENDPTLITIGENQITKSFSPSTPGGAYRVEFVYDDGDLTIEDNYVNLFTVYGELNVSDDITMEPNQGPSGTTVKIKGEELTGDMSVFFLKNTDGSDSYRVDNRAKKISYSKDVEENSANDKIIDVFTMEVPAGLEQGRYHVVLTNDVNDETDLEGKVISTKMFENNIFTVVDNDDTISIEDVDPNIGPETGQDATIHGRYIGTLSPNVFSPNSNSEFKINNNDEIDPNSTILKVSYEAIDGNGSIGKYKLIGGREGVDVTKIEREISVLVGGDATFREGSTFTNSTDKVNIRVPSINIESGENDSRDVTVTVVTTVEYEGMDKPLVITETETWDEKFIFTPISYKPSITDITPNQIPVNEDNEITNDFKISISGENFVKYRYSDEEGRKEKYPVIDLEGEVVLNPNLDDTIDIKMYDANGIEIDGTEGNDLATKIMITVPGGNSIDPGIINQISRLRVTNPIKNEEPITADDPYKHMGLSAEGNIKFVRVAPDDIPAITDVAPSTVTTDGEQGVVIKGQNFRDGISLYLDGEKINGIERNGTGTEITFNAPPKPEGYYQIILQNEEGDMAVYDDFLYVKTYTEPKIIDFNPKEGSANTLVTLKGENLLPPNPLVKDLSGTGIYRIVGTRIFLNNEDINNYNIGEDGKTIELQSYEAAQTDPIIKIEDKDLKLSDYHHSVILQDNATEAYYKIYYDTVLGKILLSDGDKNVYEISIKNNAIYGKKAGELEEKLSTHINDSNLSTNEIKIGDKVLSMLTPYEIEEVNGENKITGNKVQVINNNELLFQVPSLPREGYYDLRIVNPDTNYDERLDKNGFYYYFQPEYNPVITEINPNEGSTEGEYYINIEGDGFKDNGIGEKTSVIIGSVNVAPENIEVSSDGKTLRVKVPAYPGDLEEETDSDRKTVPVVVVNPDGGSASVKDGFTYIIPISSPKIDRLILSAGSAAGGENVILEGSGFRFFEPYKDLNNNAERDSNEPYTDLNGNEQYDDLRHWRSSEIKQKYDELLEEEDGWDKYIKPILPKIYFGGEEVTVKDFTSSTIEVETPKGIEGSVEVYLVNNDHGVSNKLNYTYEASNPNISDITPDVGRKQGNEKVEILGESFKESTVNVIVGVDKIKQKTLQIVQFGDPADTNISNRDIPIDALENSGRIRDRLATVQINDLIVEYDATSETKKLNFTLEEGNGNDKVIYKLEDVQYDDSEIFLPINLLKDKEGNPYDGYEYVRIKLEKVPGASTTKRLRVDRGFSPDAILENSRHIILNTPSYYTVGKVPVTLINPDNGRASIEFEYKNPDSEPTIRNIFKDGEEGALQGDKRVIRVNYNGGNTITILGSDFRKPVKSIAIGNAIEITEGIEYAPSGESVANRITFKMPAIAEEYLNTEYRLIVENEDGGVVGSDSADPPIYIEFTKGESDDLAITEVTPNVGPSTGGTNITIKGNDFRRTMDGYPNEEIKIYFGDGENQVKVSDSDIISVDFDKIVLKTPAYAPGTVSIKVENPDGNIVELEDAFTYLSDPKITAVVDPSDENERNPISIISVLGDTEIKLKGSGFMEGATVYFAPKLKEVEEDEIDGGDVIYIKGEAYVLEEGNEGSEYNFIDNETVTVKAPEGKLNEYGVILVNPDGGATEIYEDITYGLPELNAPTGVVAELVYDRFIRVHWNEVEDAKEYEIFVVIDDENTEFIGSTELTSFAYNDLEPRTRYRFVVKAVGDFGSSNPSMESNTVKTGRRVGPPDEDGSLTEDTVISKTGDTANVVIGEKEDDDVVIDLTRGDLAGSKKVVISMPASVVTDYRSEDIKVIGSDFTLSFNPSAFNVATVRQNEDREDAGVKFEIEPYNGNNNAPGGNVLSNIYNLQAYAYVGKSNTDIKYLAEKLNFVLDYDMDKANMRKLNNIEFNIFDDYDNSWEEVDGYISLGYGVVSGKIDVLGRYTAIGTRR